MRCKRRRARVLITTALVTRLSRLMFASKSDAARALKLNRKNMGSRYIQVFEMSQQDWTSGTAGSTYYDLPVAVASVTCHVVKLKGLPFSARQSDVVNFFAEGGYHIADEAVVMYAPHCRAFFPYLSRSLTFRLVNQQGLPRGEALVEFVNDSEASSAMSSMNKKPIGTRWIDIVPSTAGEIRAARSCGGLVPVGQSAKDIEKYAGADYEYSTFQFGEYWVKLRGLPYSITKKDVADFLLRASVVPVGIFLSEGIGYVELHSMAHVEAVLLLHKQKIGHRWVEVFHLSRAEAMQKAPQMQMQMQMQQGYGAMHMQPASTSYSPYPYAAPSSSWYPAPAAPHYQSVPVYAAPASQYGDALHSGDDSDIRADAVPPPSADACRPPTAAPGTVVKMRGLPYTCRADDVL
jgi:hypothetical protein